MRKINHGEVVLKEVSEIPASAVEKKFSGHVVVGESETVGNDHRVTVLPDTQVLIDEATIYINNASDTDIHCPHSARHDTVVLPSGKWRVDIAQEFDYLAMEKRNVAD